MNESTISAHDQRSAAGVGQPRVFLTPPRWASWRRFLALLLGVVGIILCHDLTYSQIRDYYANYPFTIMSVLLNSLLLWPLIPTYIGLSNFIGTWGFVNRIVIDKDRTTVHLLGPCGRESQSFVLDSVSGFEKGRIIAVVNGKKEDFFIKRKYLTAEIKDALTKTK